VLFHTGKTNRFSFSAEKNKQDNVIVGVIVLGSVETLEKSEKARHCQCFCRKQRMKIPFERVMEKFFGIV